MTISAVLAKVRDVLQGETLLAINFGAIVAIYLSWHLALALGWSHVPSPTLDAIVLAVGTASTAIAAFARQYVSSPATVSTLQAMIEYWQGLYQSSRDGIPSLLRPPATSDAAATIPVVVTDAPALPAPSPTDSPTPDPTTPDPAAPPDVEPTVEPIPAPAPAPADPATAAPADEPDVLEPLAPAGVEATRQCTAINSYGGRCALDLGHAGDHVTASGYRWPNA